MDRPDAKALIKTLLSDSSSDRDRIQAQAALAGEGIDRKQARQLLLDEVASRRLAAPRPWANRAWALSTLARIAEHDSQALDRLRAHLSPEREKEPWVRHWTLEGLWAGESPMLAEALDRVLSADDHPLVRQLALVIRADAGDEKAAEQIRASLESEDIEEEVYPTLRALRVVPIPDLRPLVEELDRSAPDKTILWNARKALKRMDAEGLDDASSAAATARAGVYYSDEGDSVWVGGVPVEVRQDTETGTGLPGMTAEGTKRPPGRVSLMPERRSGTRRPSGTAATESDREPRVWLAAAASRDIDWRGALEEPGFVWGGIRGKAAREALSEVSFGDPIVLLQTGEDAAIVGLATVATTPDQDELSLRLQPLLSLDSPVPLEVLSETLPRQAYVRRKGALTPLDDDDWATLRARLEMHDSTAASALPDAKAEQRWAAEIVELTLPPQVTAGAPLQLHLTVRNRGNTIWTRQRRYRVEARLEGAASDSTLVEWRGRYREPVGPGMTADIESPTANAPVTPGSHDLAVEFYGDIESTSFAPVREIATLEVRSEIANKDPDHGTTGADEEDSESLHEAFATSGQTKSADVEKDPTTEIASAAANAAPPPAKEGEQKAPDELAATPEVVDPAPQAEGSVEDPTAPAAPHSRAASPDDIRRPEPSGPDADLRHAGGDMATPRTVVVVRADYEPPPKAAEMEIELVGNEIKLSWGGLECYSPFQPPADLDRDDDPSSYGRRLFAAAINTAASRPPAPATRAGYDQALRETGHKLAVLLKAPPQPPLRWERLRDPSSRRPPLATHEGLPFYRSVGKRRIEAVRPPLRIVVAICSPAELGKDHGPLRGLQPLDVGAERRIIERGLEPLVEAGLAELTVLARDEGTAVTWERLLDQVRQGAHIVHLLAHGVFVDNRYCLAMKQEKSRPPLIDAAEVAQGLLASGAPLRLMVLQACQSGAVVAGAGPALGTTLVEEGLPAVISMQEELGIASAQVFNQRFYHHLARSGRVDMALAATRFDLYQRKIDGGLYWSTPALYLGTESGKLFEVDARAESLDAANRRLLSRSELQERDHQTGSERLLREIQAQDRGLSDEQIDRIGVALRRSEAPAEDTEAPLASPQDPAEMSRAMPRTVAIDAAALGDWVRDRTRLILPSATFVRVASALNTGKHVVLWGPPGTGKTHLAHAICEFAAGERMSAGTVPTTASADWTSFDTVGGYVPTATQRLDFRPGIFLRAIAGGRWLVVDEINRAEIDKAIGELFTVLSGQQVDLPYRVGADPVRILPFKSRQPDDWVPDTAEPDRFDYVVHPNWRILGTMNVYDRSSLFSLSFAFMRRFAFIDVAIPQEDGDQGFAALRQRWIDELLPAGDEVDGRGAGSRAAFRDRLALVFARDSPLMRHREIGPAIARDMLRHVADRNRQSPRDDLEEMLAEAFLIYAVPQLDGLAGPTVLEVHRHLAQHLFAGLAARHEVCAGLEALYPHVPKSSWAAAAEDAVAEDAHAAEAAGDGAADDEAGEG